MSNDTRHRFVSPETNLTFLFSSLTILLFVIYPLDFGPLTSSGIHLFFFIVLLSGSYAAVDRPRVFHLSLVLALATAAGRVASTMWPGPVTFNFNMAATLLFLIYTAGVVLSRVMSPGRITIHRIKGAIAVYLLLGLIWAFAYVMVQTLDPGSFRLAGEIVESTNPDTLYRPMVYLSFVTMTTLGYGDITPVSSVARSLTTLQALTGQFFIAVLVARLVAMEIVQIGSEDS